MIAQSIGIRRYVSVEIMLQGGSRDITIINLLILVASHKGENLVRRVSYKVFTQLLVLPIKFNFSSSIRIN